MSEVSIYNEARDGYIAYAKYINPFRSIPSMYDGMKPVQRRLVYSATHTTGCNRSFVKTARLCGDVMGQYHPHGNSSGSLANMVQSESSPFIGKGNWGSKIAGLPPASDRYTEIKLSKIAHEVYLNYLSEVPYHENDLGNSEPVHLPALVPYCLVSGTSGIGLGCATSIPAFDMRSLIDYISWISDGKKDKEPILKLSYENSTFDESLLTTGEGKVYYRSNIIKEKSPEGDVFVVVGSPPIGTRAIDKIQAKFKKELSENSIYVRDETTKSLRIVVARHKGVKRINNEDLLAKLHKALSYSQLYTMNWVDDESKVRTKGVYEILEAHYTRFRGFFESHKAKLISEKIDDLLLYSVAERLVPLVMDNVKYAKIAEELEIELCLVEKYTRRTLATLLQYKNQIGKRKLQGEINEIRSRKVENDIDEITKRLESIL